MNSEGSELTDYIRDIPDFPKKGIIFRDITPLLSDKDALKKAADVLASPFEASEVDYVAAVEARGFIFGSMVAERLGAGFVPIRKKGKLPWKTASATYELEYGTDTLEVHTDAIEKGAKVLMVDDLLATGGTMQAACKLMEEIGAEIAGVSFLIELTALNGREKLKNYNLKTTTRY
jgi:adenine phosphoribosyltransferase